MDWTWPNVCTSANLAISDDGLLRLNPLTVLQPVVDVVAKSSGDGKMVYTPDIAAPKVLIEKKLAWSNDLSLDATLLVRVTRGPRSIKVSQPNAIQIRDRYTTAINTDAGEPQLTGYYNSQFGASIDLGTNSTAEPNPGRYWLWEDAHVEEEWFDIDSGQDFAFWYRCGAWTPEPWSDNANAGNPEHTVSVQYTRIQFIAFPKQDDLVVG